MIEKLTGSEHWSPAPVFTPDREGAMPATGNGARLLLAEDDPLTQQLVVALLDRVNELHDNGAEEVTGVRTGFYDLDRMTAGLQKGDLVREVNGAEVDTLDEFRRAVSSARRTGQLVLLVQRGYAAERIAFDLD